MVTNIEKHGKTFNDVIAKLERLRKSKIFVVVEDNHLCSPSYRTVFNRREQFKGIDTLEIFIQSTGGHSEVAYRMARFFRQHCKRLHVIVPLMAKSAATLLCLSADAIYMGEFAELGPLDVQIQDQLEKGKHFFSPLDEFKSMEFLREYTTETLEFLTLVLAEHYGMSLKEALHESVPAVVELTKPLFAHIDPSKVGGYRRALAVGEDYAKRLLTQRGHPDADELTQKLVWNYPSHDFVIDYGEAKELGLPVERLDQSQEELLLKPLLDIINDEVTIYGFPKRPEPRKAAKGSRKARKAKETQLPDTGRKLAIA